MKNEILSLLPPGHPWGQSLICLETVDSTNTYAKALARHGAAHGTVVIAKHQTGGRGRLGRSFCSPADAGAYLSLILRPDCKPADLMHLTCAAGVAAANAVQAAAGIRPGIKWTNDLVCGKQKLGGILTELCISAPTGLIEYAVIGIGINCLEAPQDFPPEIREIACSLSTISGSAISPASLCAQLMVSLEAMAAALLTHKTALMTQFRQDCVTIGQEIAVIHSERIRHGFAENVDAQGGLIVRFPDGSTETVTSGEVSIRGMYGYL